MDLLNILLEITIYSSIIFFATMLLKACFKERMSPLLHYAVWALLIVRLMLPVTIASPVHLFTIPAETQSFKPEEQQQIHETAEVSEVNAVNIANAGLQTAESNNKEQTTTAVNTTNAETAVQTIAMSLPQILMIIWLVGMGACLLYLAVLYYVLSYKIRRNAASPPERLKALFEEVKARMGIKADVKLVCQYEYGTPALMFPKTILMPMDALVMMSDEQAEFALRHELTHYKHGDHIISIFLSFLNAIYWFNPVVWVAFRQIHTDMEVACDGAVVQHMEPAERRGYASLIVRLFAQPEHRQLVLGMAGSNAKRIAEKRVRGIFMKRESRRAAKIISALLAVVLILTCFTTACQPTPKTPAVICKGGEEPANAMPYSRSDFSDTYRDSYSKNGANIIFDAVVELPEADKLPTYEISPVTFSQAEVDSIIKEFFGDQQMYAPAKTIKSELEPAYLEALADLREKENNPDLYENSLDYYQGEVNQLKEQIENAPETDTLEPVSSSLKKSSQPGTESFSGRGDLGKDEMAVLRIMNNTGSPYTGDNSFLWFINGDYYIDISWPYPDMQSNKPAKLSITKEEAISKADEAVKLLGASHMEYAGCATGIQESGNGQYPAELDPQAPQAYLIYYTRAINGVPVTYDLRGGSSGDVEEAYSIPTMYERITVMVDDTGVAQIRWQGPIKIDSTAVENNNVIPFEDAMVLAKEQLSYLYAVYEDQRPPVEQAQAQPSSPIDNGNIVSIEVNIKKITLGLMQLPVKDGNRNELTPVWDFFGYYKKVYESGTEETHYANGKSLLTVNAVNGSIIDRDKGY